MSNQNNEVTQHIILDTCVLSCLNDEKLAEQAVAYLQDLDSRGFTLAISDFSIYENLKNAPRDKENKIYEILNIFPKFPVDQDTLVIASELSTIFQHEETIKHDKCIEDGDKIISATAVRSGSLLITANQNDFPRPFFYEVERRTFTYKNKKGNDCVFTTCLLATDYDLITNAFSNR